MRAMSYVKNPNLAKKLKTRYIMEFADVSGDLAKEWNNVLSVANGQIKLPKTYKDLLGMPFEDLLQVYNDYVTLDQSIKSGIKNQLHYIQYSKYSERVREFFIKHSEELEISTCNYCETAYVNIYTVKRERKGIFDIEHILDKGNCPIIGLSFFNFTCSCQYCNSRLKGTKPLGLSKAYNPKNSPTSDNYIYESSVAIRLYPRHGVTINYAKMLEEKGRYYFRFVTKDKDYKFENAFFDLQERYNAHIVEGLRIVQLYHKYPPSHLKMLSILLKKQGVKDFNYSEDELAEDIFGENFAKKYHRTFEKMRKDILKQCKDELKTYQIMSCCHSISCIL